VTDAAVLATQVNGVLLVARAGAATRDSVRAATRQLHSVGARVLGAVFNAVDLTARGYRYEGYYYRGEGYSSDGGNGDPNLMPAE
jgi:Mrp family chromosome partitioning ATPase